MLACLVRSPHYIYIKQTYHIHWHIAFFTHTPPVEDLGNSRGCLLDLTLENSAVGVKTIRYSHGKSRRRGKIMILDWKL